MPPRRKTTQKANSSEDVKLSKQGTTYIPTSKSPVSTRKRSKPDLRESLDIHSIEAEGWKQKKVKGDSKSKRDSRAKQRVTTPIRKASKRKVTRHSQNQMNEDKKNNEHRVSPDTVIDDNKVFRPKTLMFRLTANSGIKIEPLDMITQIVNGLKETLVKKPNDIELIVFVPESYNIVYVKLEKRIQVKIPPKSFQFGDVKGEIEKIEQKGFDIEKTVKNNPNWVCFEKSENGWKQRNGLVKSREEEFKDDKNAMEIEKQEEQVQSIKNEPMEEEINTMQKENEDLAMLYQSLEQENMKLQQEKMSFIKENEELRIKMQEYEQRMTALLMNSEKERVSGLEKNKEETTVPQRISNIGTTVDPTYNHKSLEPGEWLSSDVINDYVKHRFSKDMSIVVYQTWAIDKIGDFVNKKSLSLNKLIKSWLKPITNARSIFDRKAHIFPVNSHDNTHWSVFVVCNPSAILKSSKTEQSISFLYLDSLGYDADRPYDRWFVELLKNCALECHEELNEKALSNLPKICCPYVAKQTNYNDCGLFMLENIDSMYSLMSDKTAERVERTKREQIKQELKQHF